ncbi:unnamed protein product [Blepharisma stoltei]|uniref:Uncharacterized protein n=1 Tax=Blepharisma stoltei TaxID=1481888 RepID=A0AAU9KFW9_9CILI|nr:unnamed protein product [Blepharisma stoltei]
MESECKNCDKDTKESKKTCKDSGCDSCADSEPRKSSLIWSSMNGELIVCNCDFTGAKMSPQNQRLLEYLQSLN